MELPPPTHIPEFADSSPHWQRLLDGLREGVQVIGFDWRYRYLNRAALVHARKGAGELIGRTMAECFPGIEATDVYRRIGECLTARTPLRMDNEFTYPDGARAWFALSIEPIDDGVLILSMDITDRRRAEDALRQAEARQRALLQGLPDHVFLLDTNHAVIDVHLPNAAELPFPASELPGKPLREVLPAAVAESAITALARAADLRTPATFEYVLATTALKRAFEAVVVPMDDGRATIVSRDVTDRRAIEAQLRQAQKMEAVGQLTGGIAHDFNNILTVIGSNAELLAGAIPPGTEAETDLADLRSATERGVQLIRQLMTFSRSGITPRRPLDVSGAVHGMTSMLRRLLPASVRFEPVEAAEPLQVLADQGALEQALMNLCTNARDAMPDGGTLTIACTRTILDAGYHAGHPWVTPGPYACIAVSDTGAGMDEVTRARVFEPFFTTKPAGIGTGLGLSMVYAVMKDHEGFANIYSEPGRGTVVRLYFPLQETAASAAEPATARVAGGQRGNGEVLLLVDDDGAIRRASRRALEGQGYVVLEAGDGEEAMDLLARNRDRVALVVSDLVMPNLGGRQLVDALRARGDLVPILLMSGYADADRSPLGSFPEGVAFLHKPWTLTDLFAKVGELVRRRS